MSPLLFAFQLLGHTLYLIFKLLYQVLLLFDLPFDLILSYGIGPLIFFPFGLNLPDLVLSILGLFGPPDRLDLNLIDDAVPFILQMIQFQ